VVLHLYEEKGPDCVSLLRGMFALAVWDDKNETLLLARDRIGKKPLVYTRRVEDWFLPRRSSRCCVIPTSGVKSTRARWTSS